MRGWCPAPSVKLDPSCSSPPDAKQCSRTVPLKVLRTITGYEQIVVTLDARKDTRCSLVHVIESMRIGEVPVRGYDFQPQPQDARQSVDVLRIWNVRNPDVPRRADQSSGLLHRKASVDGSPSN